MYCDILLVLDIAHTNRYNDDDDVSAVACIADAQEVAREQPCITGERI